MPHLTSATANLRTTHAKRLCLSAGPVCESYSGGPARSISPTAYLGPDVYRRYTSPLVLSCPRRVENTWYLTAEPAARQPGRASTLDARRLQSCCRPVYGLHWHVT